MPIDNSDLHHGDYERVACIIFVSIVPVFIFARFASRILSKQVGNDDWAALAAFVSNEHCTSIHQSVIRHFTDMNIVFYNDV